MKKIIAIISLAAVTGCATVNQDAKLAAVADGATTVLALSRGAVEANPIMPSSPMGIVAVTALKYGAAGLVKDIPGASAAATGVLSIGSINNLLVVLHVANPLLGGLIGGYFVWRHELAKELACLRTCKPMVY